METGTKNEEEKRYISKTQEIQASNSNYEINLVVFNVANTIAGGLFDHSDAEILNKRIVKGLIEPVDDLLNLFLDYFVGTFDHFVVSHHLLKVVSFISPGVAIWLAIENYCLLYQVSLMSN